MLILLVQFTVLVAKLAELAVSSIQLLLLVLNLLFDVLELLLENKQPCFLLACCLFT